ncbi:hypothetical protein [Prochlorococcus sp. MIT 1306]|uniref:peptidylprolyl isomerase n=1 Tax=Prochlorococcus sp. MIT 1306 TaxID=1799667 RepID=UPI0007B3B5C8|nr:hypothetical protein [Prochlorococcus sp. MIT 1306]KZR61060.1 hypothetical protein PMIT1306_01839 [Prochlorococcus sp. MIT 1306]
MPLLRLDERLISDEEIFNVLRRNYQIPMVVRELILEQETASIALETGLEEKLLNDFCKQRQLESPEALQGFLRANHLDEALLKKMVSRPERVMRYREERWGPRANSLYLKHKDRYDMVTYRRLQCGNADLLQEVFFRIKDREESWESLARQFNPGDPQANARVGPVPASQLEPPLLEALRQSGVGKVIRPIQLDHQTVLAELEAFEASQFDNKLREQILREEFDAWLKEACSKMLNKVTFSS